jgi:hypothetical protein
MLTKTSGGYLIWPTRDGRGFVVKRGWNTVYRFTSTLDQGVIRHRGHVYGPHGAQGAEVGWDYNRASDQHTPVGAEPLPDEIVAAVNQHYRRSNPARRKPGLDVLDIVLSLLAYLGRPIFYLVRIVLEAIR